MKVPSPPSAPYLRSDATGRILAAILFAPDTDQPLTSVAAASGIPLATVQREVARLAQSGVLVTRKLGPARLVRPNPAYPLLTPLSQIIAGTFGPAQLVAQAFAGLPGLERLVLFGSWAARIRGVPGPFPRDVDVLAVGAPRRLEAIDRAIIASSSVGREVNVTVVTTPAWDAGEDGFLADIQAKPYVELETASHG